VGERNERLEVGQLHKVLVEGRARKPMLDGSPSLTGRTDTNKRVVFGGVEALLLEEPGLVAGDYCTVAITQATGHTLKGSAVARA